MIRFLALACVLSFVASGCAGNVEDGDDMAALPPWHLWGNSQIIEVPISLLTVNTFGGQLAKVSYGRPETWSFFFAAKLVSCTDDDAGQIDVVFNLTKGVGRSQVNIPEFEHFRFIWAGGPGDPFPINRMKYSESVIAPIRIDGDATSAPDELGTLVAQDIQINAGVSFTGIPGVRTANVEVSAFLAPKSHVRPEWFEAVGVFNGNETEGQ